MHLTLHLSLNIVRLLVLCRNNPTNNLYISHDSIVGSHKCAVEVLSVCKIRHVKLRLFLARSHSFENGCKCLGEGGDHQQCSQPDNLVQLCKLVVLSLFISLEIYCFTVIKHDKNLHSRTKVSGWLCYW